MLVKVLEHKWVIRLFGIFLILAPFFNFALKIATVEGINDPWTFQIATRVIGLSSKPYLVLQLSSLIIGFLMLRGRAGAWKYMLVLLAGHIYLQFSQLGSFHGDKTPWVFLLIDIGCFLFIADQLVWKVELPAAKPKAQPDLRLITEDAPVEIAPVEAPPFLPPKEDKTWYSKEKIWVHLDGHGSLGLLKDISQSGVCVTAPGNIPAQIQVKDMEILLDSETVLRMQFVKRIQDDFYFEYKNLSQRDIQLLNRWLMQFASA